MMNDRQAIQKWEKYCRDTERSTFVLPESETDKRARIAHLKTDFAAFCQYYFPHFCSAPFAPFHLGFAEKVISNDTLYIVRAWAREHAKSIVGGLFIPLYLKFTGKLYNMLLVSHSADNAEELLMPIMAQLESNQRLISDFGIQKSYGDWASGNFKTMDGCSFRSIGAGQSPRGTRNEEKRPDFILIDDIDTDEECRNPTRITQKWNWIEQALFPTMSISGTKRFVVIGNIIAKHSIVTLAAEKADSFEKINILDTHNQPSWSARYTLDDVNYMLSKISYASAQKEYFNNPLSEGAVFKDIRYNKVPPLHKFRLLVCYTDPSFKESKTNDFKGTVLIGEMEGTFYIIKAYLEQTSTAKMIEWHYDIKNLCEGHTVVYYYMEANFVQDIFIEEFRKEGVKRESQIPLAPDERKKPDKFSRIEANLEPLNRNGKLIFNEAERTNPHMKRLEEQFKAIEPSMKAHDDGPDAVEGAVWILNNKLKVLAPIKVGGIKKSLKRY